MLRHTRWFATAIALSLAFVSNTKHAAATITPYGFSTIGGFGFHFNPADFPNSGVGTVNAFCDSSLGAVCNYGLGASDDVSGSLGMGPGGDVTFSVEIGGINNGTSSTAGTIECIIEVVDINSLARSTFTGSSSVAHGALATFQIATSVPPGSQYAYSADCFLPGGGVVESTGGTGFFGALLVGIQPVGDPFLAPLAGAGFTMGNVPNVGGIDPNLKIAGGAVINSSSSVGATVYASLGMTPGGPTQFQVWGSGNGLQCILYTGVGNDAAWGRLNTPGPGYFTISTSDPIGSPTSYTVQCTIPPGGKLFGIVPAEYGKTYLGPVMGSAFTSLTPTAGFLSYGDNLISSGASFINGNTTTAIQRVYASLGHAGGGSTTFSFFEVSPGVNCTVWALDQATGIPSSFGGTTNWNVNATVNVTATVPTGANYFYSAECVLTPQGYASAYLGGVYPSYTSSTASYDMDPGTQCTVGGVRMHCCPTGYVMIGADAAHNSFKCGPLQAAQPAGPPTLDNGTQRYGMHSCPAGSVMVGLRLDTNQLACLPLPSGWITYERVDGGTHDSTGMHVCDAFAPTAAMSGIRADRDQMLCASDPRLKE
jgi:hypothetical protein